MECHFEKILDSAPGEFYWKDKEGVYLGCNQLVANLFHSKSKADIIGKKDSDLWPQYAKVLEQNDQQVMKTGQVMTFEEKINGRTNLSVKRPMQNENGEIIGIIGNSLDIHHLKEIERYLKETQEIAEAAKILANNKFSFFQPWKEKNVAQFFQDNLK